ncbi:FMN-binding negative transcriptional regulator [Frankia sp. CNm7]|uniref:FMN-binding negative transcriptional regulator n=1 Tax=Frankia nepalensis TaxID=1836974 RepID=A0A937R8Z6_9ACTN|nr:FMN-binding negative transcriptional regulator [Frankia nepalensis]MBL7501854.1 FMN-binding negative transcriptional regulator [Frankia nepalensis]MBL7511696.1 FMN-binding negative transcriptional regulator [Frankia nepalensis]MBL7519701.1 FMN-binding negative transcriptional regulator [Frankia nepalensis]MBL7625942.1 FMN-binding negative transcriptional regulator [Frankia nepalensis]
MYLPVAFRVDDEAQVRDFVADRGSATLVTVGPDGQPDASLLPVLWEDDLVVAHLARANDHWRRIATGGAADGAPALLVVTGPEAYVSPSWYPSKAEHGRVVPTWNYSAVHLRGRVTVRDDAEWLRGVVTRLTDRHETGRELPWAVGDAPERYLERQLRAIVGVCLRVESVEAKAKWSQNRSDEDRAGVLAGLPDPAAQSRVRSGSL